MGVSGSLAKSNEDSGGGGKPPSFTAAPTLPDRRTIPRINSQIASGADLKSPPKISCLCVQGVTWWSLELLRPPLKSD